MRCAVAQALARAVVKPVHCMIEILLTHLAQVGFLEKNWQSVRAALLLLQ